MLMRNHCLALALAPLAHAAVAAAQTPDLPPPAPREFRAAWVATVQNIDWPSKRGLASDVQQRELIAILDRAVEMKLNCLIVQIRTAADALYPSKLEPWSAFLSGKQGVAPSPIYDPLKMWIEEGHKRGIEIHAWFNPYRAGFRDPKLPLATTHLGVRRPDLMVPYGPFLWLDPGEPEAIRHSVAVFNDVVRRYDVDGIHIDDYFYPYPVETADKKGEVPFPDGPSWTKHKAKHPVKPNPATAPADVERVARADWRRQNVNTLIRELHATTHKIKPHVKFGISPFGIGRRGLVEGITGFDQYDKLYADAALWLREGWCDYFTPQLYWPIQQKEQSFPVLLEYWRSENKHGRPIWPGLFTSKIGEKPKPTTGPATQSPGENALETPTTKPASQPTTKPWYWSARQIADQIDVSRAGTDAPGHVHFSMRALMRDTMGVTTLLKAETYANDALVPAMPWLDDKAPPKPSAAIESKNGKSILSLKAGRGEATRVYAIWKRSDSGWHFQTVPGGWKSVELEPGINQVVVTAVDRCGNESERVRATSSAK